MNAIWSSLLTPRKTRPGLTSSWSCALKQNYSQLLMSARLVPSWLIANPLRPLHHQRMWQVRPCALRRSRNDAQPVVQADGVAFGATSLHALRACRRGLTPTLGPMKQLGQVLRRWWIVLLVSIAVIVASAPGQIVDLRITKALSDLEALRAALDNFENTHGGFPSSQEGLEALTRPPATIKQLVKDPWLHRYVYARPDPGSYLLYSVGMDGVDDAGGGDDITDHTKQYSCKYYGPNCGVTLRNTALLGGLILATLSTITGLARGANALWHRWYK